MMHKGCFLIVGVLMVLMVMQVGNLQAADPVTIGFYGITSNDPCNVVLAEPQLFVDVFNGEGNVKFLFRNEGPTACSITDIYFDDGLLLGIDTIHDEDEGFGMVGVDFERGATPDDLPGGSAVGFFAQKEFNIDSDAPPPANGVQSGMLPSEWLQIDFALIAGGTLEGVLQELLDGDLRIGMHVQGIAGPNGDTSESFINNPVPEPVSILLLGLGGLALRRRRR